VALPKIGFNEGSLLRRTLLHVATFVLGSVAFIGLMSFVLVSIAKGVVTPRTEAEDGATAVASASLKPGAVAPLVRPTPGRASLKRGATVPTTPPSKDD
jgi:hypothetical protein